MLDYLKVYRTDQGFDLPRLLNDDYFLAIKLLYNNKHYVSAMKLLMSFLDTVGYLEFEDKPGNFQLWLTTYADLSQVGVTDDELWELRNSLLHMTNLDSRKVKTGKVQRLLFYVGIPPSGFPTGDEEGKYFGFRQFIQCIAEAMSRYCASFNAEPSKTTTFFERYDRIISDTRYFEIQLGTAEDAVPEKVLFVELGINATNDDILDQMRIMKRSREEGRYDNLVCLIRGFDHDARELHHIPEVRTFCERLVNLGFISYLDYSTAFNRRVPDSAKHGWGAAEVWLCAEGRLKAEFPLTKETLKEVSQAVVESNAKADSALGPII